MKILLATMQFARGYFQGTERYVRMLAEGLTARGHDVVVLAGDPERRGSATRLGERVADALPVLHYPSRGWLAVRGLSPRRLAALLRERRVDVAHLANPGHVGLGLLEAARSLGLPPIVTIMDYWWLCPKHTLWHHRNGDCDGRVPWRECLACIAAEREPGIARLGRSTLGRSVALPTAFFGQALRRGVGPAEIARWMQRRRWIAAALTQAAAVIFPSRTALELVGPGVPPERRHAIPYGLEPRWFRRAAPDAAGADAETPSGHSLRIGYAGALAPHKGVHLLIEALRRLNWNDATLLIAGAGEAAYVEKLTQAAAGLRVELLGRVASEAMPAFLDRLDVLVIPSLWPENLPIAALEAYARGLRVIASDAGGLAEVVPASHIFARGSAAELAERLRAFRAGVLDSATPTVSTADHMVERTLDVYARAAADASGRREPR